MKGLQAYSLHARRASRPEGPPGPIYKGERGKGEQNGAKANRVSASRARASEAKVRVKSKEQEKNEQQKFPPFSSLTKLLRFFFQER